MKKIKFLSFCIYAASSFCLFSAKAGIATSLMQTAPVKAPGEYEANIHVDALFNRGGGLNISPHFQTGFIENYLDGEVFFGTGKTDVVLGAQAKFNLLPDIDGQVGLSFLGGLTFIRDDYTKKNAAKKDTNFFVLGLGTVVSKKLEVNFGHISPYAALQIEPVFYADDSYVPVTLIAGAQWNFEQLEHWVFYSEMGISLRSSLYTLGLGVGHQF